MSRETISAGVLKRKEERENTEIIFKSKWPQFFQIL